jgi:hypothetical protein
MVGDEDQHVLKGYCRLSCGTCTPDGPAGALFCNNIWRQLKLLKAVYGGP